ncbi:MAG: DNA translocase FtsK, partial [Pseudomonadota bacterium]
GVAGTGAGIALKAGARATGRAAQAAARAAAGAATAPPATPAPAVPRGGAEPMLRSLAAGGPALSDALRRLDDDDAPLALDDEAGFDDGVDAPAPAMATAPAPEPAPVAAPPATARTRRSRRAQADAQPSLFDAGLGDDPYEPPSLSLLARPVEVQVPAASHAALNENARLLETVLDDYGVRGEIVAVKPGPVVTLYELEPAPGLKASRVIGLADDIARSMSALSARIATVPGRSVIGIELPNPSRLTVYLREVLEGALGSAIEAGLAEDALIAESLAQAKSFWTVRESIPLSKRAFG